MKTLAPILFLMLSLSGISQRSVRKDQMVLSLDSVFIQSHKLSFGLSLINHSVIGYTPAYFKFFIRDRHIAKRTAVQEKELVPVTAVALHEFVAKDSGSMNFLFPQFTIARTKELVIEVVEKDGSRTLDLHIRGNKLLKMVRPK